MIEFVKHKPQQNINRTMQFLFPELFRYPTCMYATFFKRYFIDVTCTSSLGFYVYCPKAYTLWYFIVDEYSDISISNMSKVLVYPSQ